MSTKRREEGFRHNPDPIPGVETTVRQSADTGDVTVSFGDGSEDLRMDRREFLRVSGVAAATAAMAGSACRNPVEKIVPFVDRPEDFRVGSPNYYATLCRGCNAQCGALAQTRGGRPIKLEGNPAHPISRGALCARGQSWYLDLYDPSRAHTPAEIQGEAAPKEMTWEAIDAAVGAAIKESRGIALLSRTMTGSAQRALLEEIGRTIPGFKHYTYEALDSEAVMAANELAYGVPHVPHYHFDRADIVVSLGSDFLGTWLSPVEFTKQWSSRRNPEGRMARLVAFEGYLSVTGMNADDRFRARPSDLYLIAMALAHVVLVQRKAGPLARSSAAIGAVQPFTPQAVAERTGVPAEVLEQVGTELAEHAGASIVVAGGSSSAQPNGIALEAAVNLLNAALQNDGRTIDRARPSLQGAGLHSSLAQLVQDINAGKVDVLIVDGSNPVYSAAPELQLGEALKKVKLLVSTADRIDETAIFAKYLAPAGHPLENWGDSQPVAGIHTIQQPSIQPLYATRALEESLLAWFGATGAVPSLAQYLQAPEVPAGNRPGAGLPLDPGAWYRYVRAHWQRVLYPRANSLADFPRFWEDTLRVGVFIDPTTERAAPPQLRLAGLVQGLAQSLPEPRGEAKVGDLGAKELQLVATVPLYDGSQANNGHLQELPDPINKHVWGSWVAVSPKTFQAARLEQGQWVEVASEGAKPLRFQVIMQPGLHDDVIAVPVGYGRTRAGIIGNGVGQNAFTFAKNIEGRKALAGITAAAKATGDADPIAIVQGSQVIDLHRRPILASTTLEQFKANPKSGIHTHPPLPDMWGSHDYSEVKWGMSIDLSKCTGCSACVTACQEENNVPVVGRPGILEGREMHWMRIDRYYELPHEAGHLQESVTNDPMFHIEPVVAFSEFMDNPRVLNQPMLCQHCEHAPCETVCPVSATMHSADGLNQMAYNRCVGTRYCSNNCPFKVRRFNWFNYVTDRSETVFARLYPVLKEHAALNTTEPLQMANNPDVTVRARGVMEKCTFCVQRIRRARVQMKKEGRSKVMDGDVVPACAQTCPADAIVFGNLADENSAVAKLHRELRALSPLAEVGVHSSIGYLTSVWNTKAKGHDAAEGAHGAEAADHG